MTGKSNKHHFSTFSVFFNKETRISSSLFVFIYSTETSRFGSISNLRRSHGIQRKQSFSVCGLVNFIFTVRAPSSTCRYSKFSTIMNDPCKKSLKFSTLELQGLRYLKKAYKSNIRAQILPLSVTQIIQIKRSSSMSSSLEWKSGQRFMVSRYVKFTKVSWQETCGTEISFTTQTIEC